MRYALLALLLIVSAASFADRGDDILARFRENKWREAYALAREVPETAGARERGLAAYAAYRAGDLERARSFSQARAGEEAHAWQELTAGLAAQFDNDLAKAEAKGKAALGDPEVTNDARAFLFGVYQTWGRFADAEKLGALIRKDTPKGYPFDDLLPQLAGWEAVYPSFPQPVKVSLSGDGDIEIPLDSVRPYTIVKAKVNGKDTRLLVDTGGSVHPSLSLAQAKEFGIEPLGKSAAFGFGGQEEIEVARIDGIELDGVSLGAQPVALIKMLDMLKAVMNVGGVLDTRWLMDLVTTVDVENKKLRLSTSHAYKVAPGKTARLDNGDVLAAVPFALVADSKMVIPITLDGQPLWAMFDTGSPIHMLSFDWLQERLPEDGYKISASVAGGVGNTAEAPKQLVASKPMTLTVGGYSVELAKPTGQDMLDKQVSHAVGFQLGALIGMQLFSDARSFTIDGPGRTMYVVFKGKQAE